MHSLTRSRIVAAAVALSLLATACTSDATDVVIGVADDAVDDSVDDMAVAEDSSPVAVPSTDPPAPPPTTTIDGVPATTDLKARQAFELLGPAMIGVGDWAVVRGANSSESEDLDCGYDSTLAYMVDGEVVHKYKELGTFSGVRLFNGTRGQDAFVINCEDSIERVFIQGSAIMPELGWPELIEITVRSDANPVWMEYAADFAWRGDVFTGFGMDLDGPPDGPELYAFDPVERTMDLVIPRVGERVTLADARVDVLLPSSWELRDGSIVQHPTSFSHIQLGRDDEPISEPLAEGDQLLSGDSVAVDLWIRSDGGQATINGRVEATEWTFLTEDGVRIVRHVPIADGTVWIELFADSGDGAIDQDLPWLVLDTLRVFEN